MKGRILLVPVLAIGVLSVGVLSGAATGAGAAAPVATTVTIKAEGTDLSGLVKSTKPKKCSDGRKVVVWQQIGTRGGGDDIRFASDTASKQGSVYAWSTGNTGTEGYFYARVRKIEGCKGDTSKTVYAVQNP